jgi:hypothetical protein
MIAQFVWYRILIGDVLIFAAGLLVGHYWPR